MKKKKKGLPRDLNLLFLGFLLGIFGSAASSILHEMVFNDLLTTTSAWARSLYILVVFGTLLIVFFMVRKEVKK